MNWFIILGGILELIAFIYLMLLGILACEDKLSVKMLDKGIFGYYAMMITGFISIAIGFISKLY